MLIYKLPETTLWKSNVLSPQEAITEFNQAVTMARAKQNITVSKVMAFEINEVFEGI